MIGNGDISSGADVERRMKETAVSGVMVGRAAMSNPWVFREAKHYLETGQQAQLSPSVEQRWELVRCHCKLAIGSSRYGDERHTMMHAGIAIMAEHYLDKERVTVGLGSVLKPNVTKIESSVKKHERTS